MHLERETLRSHSLPIYTGPYYLAMILPVLALASSPISASIYMWVALALLILVGGWAIRWTTEQKWGRYSNA